MIKRIIITLLFIYQANSFGQSAVVEVENWVTPPENGEFEKPLIFLEFWATWCLPCIHVIPEVEHLNELYGNQVAFLHLSNEPYGTVEKFMIKKGLSFMSGVSPNEKSVNDFQVAYLPYAVLLDPSGNSIWTGSPADMTPSLMNIYVNKFQNKKGNQDRILALNESLDKQSEEYPYSNYKSSGKIIQYRPSNIPDNRIEQTNNNTYLNMDIQGMVAYLFNAPTYAVDVSKVNNTHFEVNIPSADEKTRQKIFERFLNDIVGIDIKKESRATEIYQVKPTGESEYSPNNLFDFTEENISYTADDQNVEMDNVTANKMIDILNNFSESRFYAKGFDDQKHDWKVHYKFLELTLDQFKNEYHFDVSKESRNMPYYIVTTYKRAKKSSGENLSAQENTNSNEVPNF